MLLDDEWVAEKPEFHFKTDDVIMSRKSNETGTPFNFYRSLYADDGAFLFASRRDIEQAAPVIFRVLKAFSLTMHVGRNGKPAKSEAVFFPSAAATKLLNPADIAQLDVDGGTISFSNAFKYLGSIIAGDLSDDAECDARISAASKAFGSLRPQFFTEKGVETRAKKAAYEAIVLNLLLYGCECWAISASMRRKLLVFHRRCVRAMCGFNTHTLRYSGDGGRRLPKHRQQRTLGGLKRC
mmetsp:Transcript_43406/g.84765  ORF Transcript_43406/g.84765 Transcript_43406/m.84765 type:complete len:239 (-) Transcript_43406:2917-3633(-)